MNTFNFEFLSKPFIWLHYTWMNNSHPHHCLKADISVHPHILQCILGLLHIRERVEIRIMPLFAFFQDIHLLYDHVCTTETCWHPTLLICMFPKTLPIVSLSQTLPVRIMFLISILIKRILSSPLIWAHRIVPKHIPIPVLSVTIVAPMIFLY